VKSPPAHRLLSCDFLPLATTVSLLTFSPSSFQNLNFASLIVFRDLQARRRADIFLRVNRISPSSCWYISNISILGYYCYSETQIEQSYSYRTILSFRFLKQIRRSVFTVDCDFGMFSLNLLVSSCDKQPTPADLFMQNPQHQPGLL
jgi:hypothetical protein